MLEREQGPAEAFAVIHDLQPAEQAGRSLLRAAHIGHVVHVAVVVDLRVRHADGPGGCHRLRQRQAAQARFPLRYMHGQLPQSGDLPQVDHVPRLGIHEHPAVHGRADDLAVCAEIIVAHAHHGRRAAQPGAHGQRLVRSGQTCQLQPAAHEHPQAAEVRDHAVVADVQRVCVVRGGALERAHQLCGCPDPVVYGAAAYFQNLLHFVPPASLGGNTAQLHLRPSPDVFHRSIGSKSLRYCAAVGGFAALRMRHAPCGYTKYICTFQTLSRQKISRRMLSLNRAVLPLIMPYCNTSPRLRQPREKAAPARKQEPPGDQKRK